MAATDPSARDASSAPRSDDAGVGMNHPTVVPTNFDPEDDDHE